MRNQEIHPAPALKRLLAASMAVVLAGAASSAFAAPTSYDKKFMEKAADSGSTEISASKLADGKAGDAAVKTFAATMVTDHTQVANELKTLATSKSVTLSDEPSKAHQAEIKKLGGLDGATFDKEYASKIGISAHKDAVSLFADASKNASDPDVKAFAAKTLPALQHHLDMATQLQTTLAKK